MIFIILGKPLVFWLGLIALISFIYQIYLGYRLTHGHSEVFKVHKINALILSLIVIVHLVLGLLMYFG